MKDGDLLLIQIQLNLLSILVDKAIKKRRLLEIILKGGTVQ